MSSQICTSARRGNIRSNSLLQLSKRLPNIQGSGLPPVPLGACATIFITASDIAEHGVNLTSLFGRIIANFERGKTSSGGDLHFVNHCLVYIPNDFPLAGSAEL